jgi:ubiquinone/menaquinone biosynthesis C-methylase UbiE
VTVVQSAGELRYRRRCLEKTGYRFRGDERLLDAGCGNGGVAALLREHVREVVAVDVERSPEWQDANGLRFIVADAERLPFEDASFDVVHSKDALHHMESPEAALEEYRRVVRPGGSIVIIEGNRYNPLFYLHMTRMLGHEHFTRARFRSLVGAVFGDARFGSFEAHYVPHADRILGVQHAIEQALEYLPGARRLLSYNFAVATIPP